MKGISLIKIIPKGYVLEFKKMIPQNAVKSKKGSKNNKKPKSEQIV
ncbi:hypothetical protein HPNQ4053_0823 [Helicobacter pylori NQ4053]|uniref:Uncharacterized protein n=1 Tax=Helicobacter pylori NQ4053 TaxID=992027 RepID=I9QGV4_HELPX|nr:hypothetical protein HPNQ4053_0823 [Helicobacter pylori NQ4053]